MYTYNISNVLLGGFIASQDNLKFKWRWRRNQKKTTKNGGFTDHIQMDVDADGGVRVDLTLVAAAVVQLRRLDLQRPITWIAKVHRQPVVVGVGGRADGQQLHVVVDVPQPGNLLPPLMNDN